MRTITRINVWKSNKGEFRVYVSFKESKTQGCYYKSGNSYQEKGSLVDMSEEEKAEALKISSKKHGKGTWGNVYENEISKNVVRKDFIKDTENWMPNKMKSDLRKGYPVNVADYLNM